MKNSDEAWNTKHAKKLDFSRKNGIFRAPEKVGEKELSPLLSCSYGFDSRWERFKGIQEELSGVKEQNLSIYLQELFESFYEIQEKFNKDCKYDKEEDIKISLY